MLGDRFLKEAFTSFRAIQSSRNKPYLHQYYEVIGLHARNWHDDSNVLTRFNDALVEQLNVQPRLPRYIMIFIDRDIIAEAQVFDFGVYRTLQDLIKWLLININCQIETRKEDLKLKRPGAVTANSEPRLVWIKMARRPDYSVPKNVHSLASKFNNILEETIAGDKRSHILNFRIERNKVNFDCSGNFTPEGFIEYWRQIDQTMREFDHGDTDLTP